MADNTIYEVPEQKMLRYKKPEGSIAVNASSLLFARFSFWQFQSRIDVRKYFATKLEHSKNPEINSRLMPAKKGICLTFPETLELVKVLRSMLKVAKYCPDEMMEPDEEMIQAAMAITDLGSASDSVTTRKRRASDSGSEVLDDDKLKKFRLNPKVSYSPVECSQALE